MEAIVNDALISTMEVVEPHLTGQQSRSRGTVIMAIGRGLDGAIVNPLDAHMMGAVVTAEMLVGRDDFCMHYLKAYRAGLLGQTPA